MSDQYQPGPASLFAAAAREPKQITQEQINRAFCEMWNSQNDASYASKYQTWIQMKNDFDAQEAQA